MNWSARNGLTLEELEQLEEAAHHSQTVEAKSVLRIAAALREALQLKECALYTESKDNPERILNSSPGGREQQIARYEDAKIEIDLERGRTT